MTTVVRVVGSSGSGKTTLIERVVPLLRERGLEVATVKHAHHGYDADRPGSDSARHWDAGAAPVLLIGPDRRTLHQRGDVPPLSVLVDRHLRYADLVLVEGYWGEPAPTVVVRRRDVPPRAVDGTAEVILTLTDEPTDAGSGAGAVVGPDDLDAVADALAALVVKKAGPDVRLTVDGRTVPLTGFAARALAGAVAGMVAELERGAPNPPADIELSIRP